MKKWSEISNFKKVLAVLLISAVVLSGMWYFMEVMDDDNYKTIIECGDEIIELNGTGYDLEEYCPEAFVEHPGFYPDFNVNITIGEFE